jgi:ATP-dependent Clp protease ATP-binding subunit ClpA
MNSVKDVLDGAATYACFKGYKSIGVHLLAAATLQSDEVSSLLNEWNIDDTEVFHEILDTCEQLLPNEEGTEVGPLRLTEEAKLVYKLSNELAKSLSLENSPLLLLAALLEAAVEEGHFEISRILDRHNIDPDEVYERVASKHIEMRHAKNCDAKIVEKIPNIIRVDEYPYLSKFTTNLSAKAREGRMEPIFGRQREIERVIRILCRKRKNNPVLIGEPGVGKTAIAEELARLIAIGEVPPRLKSKWVVSLDLGGLVGGTKWRGELEERVKGVIAEIQRHGDIILFIDEIHMLTGRMLDGCSDMFKPALANGDLTSIGATTHSEYLMHFEKDAAMARRFQPVMVNEPDFESAVKMIAGVLPSFAEFHGVAFEPSVPEYAVEMAIRHIPRQMLPDKAIDLVDEASAIALSRGKPVVTVGHINEVIENMIGEPVSKLAVSDIAKKMRSELPGPDNAFQELEYFLKVCELRLSNGKVRGTAALVGKNPERFVQKLTEYMGTTLLTIDGSEYQHENSLWQLIGTPPGYKDHEKGGHLTESLRRNPRAIVTVANIEQAASDVQLLLRDMVAEGKVTDSAQRPVPASEISVILLSQESEGSSFGFAPSATKFRKSYGPFSGLIDVEITVSSDEGCELNAEFDRLLKELNAKARKSAITFTCSESLRTEIIEECRQSSNPLEHLQEQFGLRVKRAGILGNQDRTKAAVDTTEVAA